MEKKKKAFAYRVPIGDYNHLQCQLAVTCSLPLWQWGFRQCLPFIWKTLRGKHCRQHIAVMRVVDTIEQYVNNLLLVPI